jgi:hypothetical protein
MPMDSFAPKRYPPVGRCIYCGDPQYDQSEPARVLGDEHIIALSLGGTLVLPEASCKACEKLTSSYDTHCAEQFAGPNREHLGLRSRRRNKRRSRLSVMRDIGGYLQRVDIPVTDHFAALLMFKFQFPGVLLGFPPTEDFTGTIVMASLHPDPGRRSRLTGNVNIIRRGGFHAPVFGRMLAKVAHSYAVAECGLEGFKPVLPNLIRNIGPQYLSRYIGSEIILGPEPNSANRHELSIELYNGVEAKDFLVVRLRLFANRGMPTYYIVAGSPTIRLSR